MHVHFLDPYRPRRSPVHNLDARVKLALAVGFIFTTALMPVGVWPLYVFLFALALTVEVASELGVRTVLSRASLALPFALAALPLVFMPAKNAAPESLAQVLGVTISLPGLERFVSIALKSWLSVQIAIVLAASTPFPDLLAAMRALRAPRLLVSLFGLMWRYLFVLADEALRLMRARAARSGSSDASHRQGGSVMWRARVVGGMAGNLFLRAFERSDRIFLAMLARGYDGEPRAIPLPPVKGWHWAALAVGIGLLAGLLWLGFVLG